MLSNEKCRKCGHDKQRHAWNIPGGFINCEVIDCKCTGFEPEFFKKE